MHYASSQFKLSCLLSATILLFTTLSFAGGPWTQSKGGGYVQLSFSSITAQSLFNSSGNSYQLYRKVADQTLQAYMEYGITDNLTLLSNLPFKFVSTGEETFEVDSSLVTVPFPSGSLTAIGNISLAAKYKLLDTQWQIAAQFRVDESSSSYDAGTALQTGYDCWSYQPMLFTGYSKNNWYGFISAGFTIRSNHFSESINMTGEAGYGFFKKKTYLILMLDLDKSFLNDSTQREDYLRTGLYVNNQEFLAIGLKLNQSIGDHWSINGSIIGAAYGNLVAEAPSFNLGIAYKL